MKRPRKTAFGNELRISDVLQIPCTFGMPGDWMDQLKPADYEEHIRPITMAPSLPAEQLKNLHTSR